MNIEETYKNKCQTKTDINEHLPTLFKYAKMVKHITELGTRYGESTWAFLHARPERLISHDINKTPPVQGIENAAKNENIDYTFNVSDSLTVKIEETDLLFIDTFHSYAQLITELNMHSHKAKKYIILHDTTTYGEKDMPNVGPISTNLNQYKLKYPDKQGLFNATLDFIDKNHEWEIAERYENNNGLTVLQRKTA